jgi:hypothetical protein
VLRWCVPVVGLGRSDGRSAEYIEHMNWLIQGALAYVVALLALIAAATIRELLAMAWDSFRRSDWLPD